MRYWYWFIVIIASPLAMAEPAGSPIKTSDIISGIMSLGLVLVSIVVCAWFLKKSRLAPAGGGQLKVVSSLALGTRERILVVEAGKQQYLLGVTSGQINLLDKLETPLSSQAKPLPAGFAKQLNRVIKGNDN